MSTPPRSSEAPAVSVVVVVHDRPDETWDCLSSFREQTEAHLEICVVPNEASDAVMAVIDRAAARDPRIRVVPFAGGSASMARNQGSKAARAPLLYFVDDDVCVPPNGIATLVEEARAHPEASILGGPNLTPPSDPPFAQMSGALLGSRWGTAIARPRYSSCAEGPARERDLILCNLAIRRRVFDEGVRFPTLFGGEENVLMGQAEHRGLALWYSPRLWVFHKRRGNLLGYLRQVYRYGWGRANAVFLAPRTAHPVYFVPVGFLLYLLGLPLLAVLTPFGWLPLALYAAGTVASSIAVAVRHRRPRWIVPLMLLYPATHLAYAAGLLGRVAKLELGSLFRATTRGRQHRSTFTHEEHPTSVTAAGAGGSAPGSAEPSR